MSLSPILIFALIYLNMLLFALLLTPVHFSVKYYYFILEWQFCPHLIRGFYRHVLQLPPVFQVPAFNAELAVGFLIAPTDGWNHSFCGDFLWFGEVGSYCLQLSVQEVPFHLGRKMISVAVKLSSNLIYHHQEESTDHHLPWPWWMSRKIFGRNIPNLGAIFLLVLKRKGLHKPVINQNEWLCLRLDQEAGMINDHTMLDLPKLVSRYR